MNGSQCYVCLVYRLEPTFDKNWFAVHIGAVHSYLGISNGSDNDVYDGKH